LAIFERLNTPDAEKLRGYLRHVQELMDQKPRRSRKAKTAHDLGAE